MNSQTKITVGKLTEDFLKFEIEYNPIMCLMVSEVLQMNYDDVDADTIITMAQAKIIIETTNVQSRFYEFCRLLEIENPPFAQAIQKCDANGNRLDGWVLLIEQEHITDKHTELFEIIDHNIMLCSEYKLKYGEMLNDDYIINNEFITMLYDFMSIQD